MTLEDRPAAAISSHVAVRLFVAQTVLAESRDDATRGVGTAASAIVQTVGETVSGDDTARGGWDCGTGDVWDDTAGGGCDVTSSHIDVAPFAQRPFDVSERANDLSL